MAKGNSSRLRIGTSRGRPKPSNSRGRRRKKAQPPGEAGLVAAQGIVHEIVGQQHGRRHRGQDLAHQGQEDQQQGHGRDKHRLFEFLDHGPPQRDYRGRGRPSPEASAASRPAMCS